MSLYPDPSIPNPRGVFAQLPVELVEYITSFLGTYEAVGLGATSKWFRRLIKDRFHYEPWAYDPTHDLPMLTPIWKQLGTREIGLTNFDLERRILPLAMRAYATICQNVFTVLQTEPQPHVGCELVASIFCTGRTVWPC